MKLSNLHDVTTTGTRATTLVFNAFIDVTTGFWVFEKTETLEIQCDYGDSWFFVETGEWVRENIAELFRSWEARTNYKTPF